MVSSSAWGHQTLIAALGMASPDGQVSSDSGRKLAQVKGMLPWLLRALNSTRHVSPTAIEFGCGKAHLSFFVAQAVRDAGERPVRILGVDPNADLIRRCQRARDILGWREIDFRVATCQTFSVPYRPVLVCALHACDIVTDHAMAAAINMGAEHIVVAPCCHSTNQRRLRETGHRHEWGYVARCFPLLGSRFSEFVTEAMRCLALRACGYEVQVREFVSGTATPKNTVIIAFFTGKPSRRARDELRRIEEIAGLESEVQRSLDRRHATRSAADPSTLCYPRRCQERGDVRHV